MNPFEYLEDYGLLVCASCEYAVLVTEIPSHVKTKHPGLHRNKQTPKILHHIKDLSPLLYRKTSDLETFRWPPPTSVRIPYLAAPRAHGLRCRACDYVVCDLQTMKEHCRKIHGWQNPVRRGRAKRDSVRTEAAQPWATDIRVQRFFVQGSYKRWFEVERDASTTSPDTSSRTIPAAAAGSDLYDAIMLQKETLRSSQLISAGDNRNEPNSWLNRTGWAAHFKGWDCLLVYDCAAITPDVPGRFSTETEETLQRCWRSLARVAEAAERAAQPTQTSYAVLYELARKSADVKTARPFRAALEPASFARYLGYWKRILAYFFRMDHLDDEDVVTSLPFHLTDRQNSALEYLYERLDEDSAPETSTDRALVDFLVGLLDQVIEDGPYESALLSALAALGVEADGGWARAIHYTTTYSAVIKFAKLFVFYQSRLERDEMLRENPRETASLYGLVRAKMRRFMVVSGATTRPSPMDWIYDTRSYGLRIRYTTPVEGQVRWVGKRLHLGRVNLSMDELGDMIRSLVHDLTNAMGELLLPSGEASPPAWPLVEIADDLSVHDVHFSFLSDPRNRAQVTAGDRWLLRRVTSEPGLARDWIDDSSVNAQALRTAQIEKYGRQVDRFRTLLLLAIHLTAGQPARGPEILGLRFRNTPHGGLRNLFVDRGEVFFVVWYHKAFLATDAGKIITRVLPHAVGVALVQYLWLVLPFWHDLQMHLHGGHEELSSFLWAESTVQVKIPGPHEPGNPTDPTDPGPADGPSRHDGASFVESETEVLWSSNRLSRILRDYTARFFGTGFGIAAWRHITAAMVQRFFDEDAQLTAHAGLGYESDDEGDDSDDETVFERNKNSLWHTQSAHSSWTTGNVYGRLAGQLPGTTYGTEMRYRRISQIWHRYFRLDPSPDAAFAEGCLARKVTHEQSRRLIRLENIDLDRHFTSLIKKVTAGLRPEQREVLRSVVKHRSPILQVSGTGSGKSFSFLLPAYCASDGVTIVIVPLLALQDSLVSRCEQYGITATRWQAGEKPKFSTIVFVTPESLFHADFADFANRLLTQGHLDRIVLDECHVVLDATSRFRPDYLRLGPYVGTLGVQLVFLTATLPPADIERFCTRLRIPEENLNVFRQPTTRANISYRIWDRKPFSRDHDVVKAVLEAVGTSRTSLRPAGKTVVYCQWVGQAKLLSERLDSPLYHADVADVDGKREILTRWARGTGLMVATSALALGVDYPDIELVIHLGPPRNLRDYVQETGRAGRDSRPSRAVLILDKGYYRRRPREATEAGLVIDFVLRDSCRRVLLDAVMDGDDTRTSCHPGEEFCDWCHEQREKSRQMEGQIETIHSEAAALRDVVRKETERQALELQNLIVLFDLWSSRCIACGLARRDNCYEKRSCRHEDRGRVQQYDLNMRRLRALVGRFTNYVGCIDCGVPQVVCRSWRLYDTRITRTGEKCQYGDLLLRLFTWFYLLRYKLLRKTMLDLGYEGDTSDYKTILVWLPAKRYFGQTESNNLCVVVYQIIRTHL